MKKTIASVDSVKRIVLSMNIPSDAIDPDMWSFEVMGQDIVASNAYRVVDRHGHYDVRRRFRLRWRAGDDILAFIPEIDPISIADDDSLRAYISGAFIEKALSDPFK